MLTRSATIHSVPGMTVAQIIDALGGPASLARELGFPPGDVGPKRVRAWLIRDRIPAAYDVALVRLAKRCGFALTLERLAQMRATDMDRAA